MSVVKNQDYVIEITGMTGEGSGVGKVEGFAVFVPMAAVGDVILVKIVKVLKSYAFGRIVEITKPSESRIPVDCECFNQCGGCEYRHISYASELEIKQGIVANAFVRLGGIDTPCSPIIGSERVTAYRNKAQYPVGVSATGTLVSGFYARRSHRIIDYGECLLQPKIFAEIQRTVLDFLSESKASIYDESTHKGLIRHIYIRQAEATQEIMVCVVATNKVIPQVKLLIERLTVQFKDIKSIVINVNSDKTNVIMGAKCFTIFGKESIADTICGINVNISPLSFYQVNKLQAEVLYKKALALAQLKKEDILLDLYCGTGTIGLIAASDVLQVIGVEIVEQAIEDAKENANANGISNCRFICADAKKAAQTLLSEGIIPSVIIVDPPRKGLDIAVIEAITAMKPERIVMISCNPATAARDVKELAASGYMVSDIVPVDMFARTVHVECVVGLQWFVVSEY